MPTTIENAPALEIDKVLYARTPMLSRTVRERRIVWNLMKHLEKSKFSPVSVWDGDELTTVSRDPKAAMELIFNLDDAIVYFSTKAKPKERHAVKLVLGNDTEIISDWTFNATDSDGFNAAMDKFNSEAYA